jgi:branched-chain amino acid transport system ATP-binding protein
MRFGGLTAVNDVNLRVNEGEIVGLIGPNGAGKTTFFNCLTGMYKPTEGDREVPGHGSCRPSREGGPGGDGSHLPEHPPLRQHDGVGERHGRSLLPNSAMALTSIIRGPKYRARRRPPGLAPRSLLDFVGLGKTSEHLARNLPYGDQRRLEIARALATDPKLILLDEPTAGMNPKETEEAKELIFRIRDMRAGRRRHRARHAVHLQPCATGCSASSVAPSSSRERLVRCSPIHRVIEAYIGGRRGQRRRSRERDAGGP